MSACSDLYRIGLALLEIFIESYDQPPKKLTIDIDDTDDPTHGAQQLTFCSMPTMTSIATCRSISTKGSRAS